MAAGTMSLAQFCLLATALSALVYYLTTDNICGTAGSLQGTTILGTRLNPSNGKQHVLVTGGAGYIGSHAALRLLRDGHAVTVLDNLSRGNLGAVNVLKQQASPGQFQFIEADLGHGDVVKQIFQTCKFDTVMHFAAVAYVGARYCCTCAVHLANLCLRWQHCIPLMQVVAIDCAVWRRALTLLCAPCFHLSFRLHHAMRQRAFTCLLGCTYARHLRASCRPYLRNMHGALA